MRTSYQIENLLIFEAEKNQEVAIHDFLKLNWTQLNCSDIFFNYFPDFSVAFANKSRESFLLLTEQFRIYGTIAFTPLLTKISSDICFLKYFYIHPEMRGMGLGKRMLKASMLKARNMGYQKVYLETKDAFSQAVTLYSSYGFKRLPQPLLMTGLPANIFMMAEIDQVLKCIEKEKIGYHK